MDVIEYDTAHREAVLEFGTEYGLRWGGDPALFDWKYQRQLPDEHATEAPRLWLVSDGARVLGVFGAQPTTLIVDGERVSAAYAMDVHLHAELRGKGFGGRLLGEFEAAYAVRLMPFSTDVAHGLYLHRGYREIPELRAFTSVTRTVRAALRVAAQRLNFGSAAKRPASLLQRVDLVEREIQGARAETSETLGDLEPFLNEVQTRYAVCAARGPDTLRWRYLEHPYGGGAVVSLRGSNNEVIAVFGIAWCATGGLDALVLTDLYQREGDAESAERIVLGLKRVSRHLGADLVSMIALSADLQSAGHRFDRSSSRRFAVSAPADVLDPEIGAAGWYLTAGDSDQIG